MKAKVKARMEALKESADKRATKAERISFAMRSKRELHKRQLPTVEQLDAMLSAAQDPTYYTDCGPRSRSPITAFAEAWGETPSLSISAELPKVAKRSWKDGFYFRGAA